MRRVRSTGGPGPRTAFPRRYGVPAPRGTTEASRGLAEATGAGGLLRVEYERFVRAAAPTEVTVSVAADIAALGRVRLRVLSDYLAGASEYGVAPEPEEVVGEHGALVHLFRTGESPEPLRVTFRLRVGRIGSHRAEFALSGLSTAWFWQFAHP
ncbi:MAG TPA: hypothetical protein VKZ89_04755 [Thermobifida alba]|nr:hypothetical protein [Thermobifida alba]